MKLSTPTIVALSLATALVVAAVPVLVVLTTIPRGNADRGMAMFSEFFEPIPSDEDLQDDEYIKILYDNDDRKVLRALSGIRLASPRITPAFASQLVEWACSSHFDPESHIALWHQICGYGEGAMEPALLDAVNSCLQESAPSDRACIELLLESLNRIDKRYPIETADTPPGALADRVNEVASIRASMPPTP